MTVFFRFSLKSIQQKSLKLQFWGQEVLIVIAKHLLTHEEC